MEYRAPETSAKELHNFYHQLSPLDTSLLVPNSSPWNLEFRLAGRQSIQEEVRWHDLAKENNVYKTFPKFFAGWVGVGGWDVKCAPFLPPCSASENQYYHFVRNSVCSCITIMVYYYPLQYDITRVLTEYFIFYMRNMFRICMKLSYVTSDNENQKHSTFYQFYWSKW